MTGLAVLGDTAARTCLGWGLPKPALRLVCKQEPAGGEPGGGEPRAGEAPAEEAPARGAAGLRPGCSRDVSPSHRGPGAGLPCRAVPLRQLGPGLAGAGTRAASVDGA